MYIWRAWMYACPSFLHSIGANINWHALYYHMSAMILTQLWDVDGNASKIIVHMYVCIYTCKYAFLPYTNVLVYFAFRYFVQTLLFVYWMQSICAIYKIFEFNDFYLFTIYCRFLALFNFLYTYVCVYICIPQYKCTNTNNFWNSFVSLTMFFVWNLNYIFTNKYLFFNFNFYKCRRRFAAEILSRVLILNGHSFWWAFIAFIAFTSLED